MFRSVEMCPRALYWQATTSRGITIFRWNIWKLNVFLQYAAVVVLKLYILTARGKKVECKTNLQQQAPVCLFIKLIWIMYQIIAWYYLHIKQKQSNTDIPLRSFVWLTAEKNFYRLVPEACKTCNFFPPALPLLQLYYILLWQVFHNR